MKPEELLEQIKKDLQNWIEGNKDQTIKGIHGVYQLKGCPDMALAWSLVLKRIERLEKREA